MRSRTTPAKLRQIHAGVDAAKLERIRETQRLDRKTTASVDGDQIRQVVLALRIVGGQAVQRVEERFERQRIDAAVHFVESTFFRRGVPFLDDARDGAGGVPNDTAVAMRVRELGRENRRRGARAAMAFEKAIERFPPK